MTSSINVRYRLCEVTQHIPVLDEGKLNVYRDNLPPMPSEYIVEVEEVQTGLRLHP